MTWQDISTAPKDGTEILGLMEKALSPILCFWDVEWKEWRDSGEMEIGSWDDLMDYRRKHVCNPAYWSPIPALPAPPQEEPT